MLFMSKVHTSFSRRQFIKKSALGLAGGVLPGVTASIIAKPVKSKSTVVLVRHSKVIDAAGKVQQPIVEEMITKALTTLTGKRSVKDAWRMFVSPEDVAGLKVSTLGLMSIAGTEYVSHYSAVTSAIHGGLKKAKVQDKNIIIWDRSDEELVNAGFSIRKQPEALRVFGTCKTRKEESIGYSSNSYQVGSLQSRVTKIVTDITSVMINIPALKTHRLAGITGALKCHYGTIDNPGDMHDNNCTNPGIAEVNTISIIRKKQKLIIADALLGLYEGGPWWQQSYIWPYGGILVGTDPVAVDAVMLSIIDEKRKKEALPSVKDIAKNLLLSENLGLGTSSLDAINLVKIKMG